MDKRVVVQSWIPYVTNNPSWTTIFSSAEIFSLLRSYSELCLFVVFLSLFSHFSMYTVVSRCVVSVLRVTSIFLLLSVSQSLSSVFCMCLHAFLCVVLVFVQRLFIPCTTHTDTYIPTYICICIYL